MRVRILKYVKYGVCKRNTGGGRVVEEKLFAVMDSSHRVAFMEPLYVLLRPIGRF